MALEPKFQADVDAIQRIDAVPTILDVVCRTTGMGFAAVARVTESRWIACSVMDKIAFGLEPGGELKVETTICHEIRQHRKEVVIDDVSTDEIYCNHHTPATYGLKSYISVPIVLKNGQFFGTLCAIDPNPAKVNKLEIIETFKLFAELIAFHLHALQRIDITEATLQEELKHTELREQFIAVLGHDLRNPLGAISSSAMLLEHTPLNDRGKILVNLIKDCSVRMTELISNILDFARGRLGSDLTLALTSEPLEPMLERVINEIRASAPKRIIELSCNITEAVNCDHSRISQVLSNILGNAIAYGAKDQPIKISAVTNNHVFELSVANGGQQIPEKTMERLFSPFSRGEVKSNQQGLGLGLYIAHQIATSHGGTLTATSSPEQTCFTLKIPTNFGVKKAAA